MARKECRTYTKTFARDIMNILIALLAIFGLAFAIKETDGPWNMMGHLRNLLFRLPWVGVVIFKLLDCYFCTGWWAGLVVYFLTQEPYKLGWAICWALTGGTVCLIIDGLLLYLHREPK